MARGEPLKARKEEGMPSTEGLSVFIRRSPLTDEEWLSLIEARRELIKSCLDSLTLPDLGSLKCLRTGGFSHAIQEDIRASSGDARFSLQTQGIFRRQPFGADECDIPGLGTGSGRIRVWGLTRSGLWVIASIIFARELGYRDRGYERAVIVSINEADLSTVVAKTKETPQHIWTEIGGTIKVVASHRKALYEKARKLAQMVEVEELALSLTYEEDGEDKA